MLLTCMDIPTKDCIWNDQLHFLNKKFTSKISSFPYDFESTPGYEITYGLNCIYNVYLATYFAACDLFLVNCGLHLISATQDLEAFFKELDTARRDELHYQPFRERYSNSDQPIF